MPNIQVRGHLIQKLLSRHSETHTHTGTTALTGPLVADNNVRKTPAVKLNELFCDADLRPRFYHLYR